MSADPFNDLSTTSATTATTTGPSAATPETSSSPPAQPVTSPSLTSGSASPPPAAAPGSTTTSPPPTVTTVSPTPPAPQRQERDGPIDERVSNLRAMFPDYDDLILQSVLESVNWNQDRAIDTLLGMSDPEYKPQTPQQPQLTQTELDEQLARRLLLEDQQTHQQWLQQQQQPQGPPQPGVPYQTRPGHQWSPQPTPGGGQGQGTGTGMQEISEQFNKIAETGKKTFGTIFNKVKAKIQEFDQTRPGAGSSQPPPQGPGPNHAWSQAQPTTAHAHVPSAQPAYYAPAPAPSPPQNPTPAPAPTRISPLSAVQGYDATPNREPSPKPLTKSSPPPAAANTSSNSSTTAAALPASSTTTAQPINAGKFGLLPKRPVSLLRETPPPAEGAGASVPKPAQPKPADDGYDSDGLEYTENPFEETRK